jgi:hypothetical protein
MEHDANRADRLHPAEHRVSKDGRAQSRPGELAGCDPGRWARELAVAFVAVLQGWHPSPGDREQRRLARLRSSRPVVGGGVLRRRCWRGAIAAQAYGANGGLLLVCCTSKCPLWWELILADQDRLIGDGSGR